MISPSKPIGFMLYILKVFKYENLKIRYLEYKLKVDACELIRGWGGGISSWAKVVTNKPENVSTLVSYFLI